MDYRLSLGLSSYSLTISPGVRATQLQAKYWKNSGKLMFCCACVHIGAKVTAVHLPRVGPLSGQKVHWSGRYEMVKRLPKCVAIACT